MLYTTVPGVVVGIAAGVNDPITGLTVQVAFDAPPPNVAPVRVTVCALADWQTTTSGPASTVAGVLIVAVTGVLAETQVPFLDSA